MKSEWRVSSEESGLSILDFLKKKIGPDYSARKIKQMVDTGFCTLNGRVERFASKSIGTGDRLSLILNEALSPKVPLFDSTRILYQDDAILAYNKPPGVVSDDHKFLKELEKAIGSSLILLHRLDKETSGVLLFSKSKECADHITEQFRLREVKKCYYAIVDGVVGKQTGVIENFLGKRSVYQGQAMWGSVEEKKGLFAKTLWKVRKKGKTATWMECHPETGRTHQIRVHMAEMGHPILGDFQYGRVFHCPYRPSRILLHAADITLQHPYKTQMIYIQAPIPDDFKMAMEEVL